MSTRAAWLVAIGLAAVAVVLVVVAGAHGIGLTPDSAEYLFGAKHLAATGTYRSISGDWQQMFPPGFPATVALVHLLGPAVDTAARIVNALAAGVTVLLTFALLRAHLRSITVVLAATALVAIAPPLIANAATAWSEPQYIALTTGLLLVLTADLARGATGLRLIGLAGFVAGVANLTHALGVSLLPAGLLVIGLAAWHHRQRVTAALARAGVFTGAFVLAPALWIVPNLVHGAPAFGSHGESVKGLATTGRVVLANVSDWFLPHGVPTALRVLGVVAVVAALAFAAGRIWIPLVVTSGAVVVTLLAFCTFAAIRSGADVTTRVLSPALVPALVLTAALLDRVLERHPARALVVVAVVGAVALGGLFAVRTAQLVDDRARHGYGFATDPWQQSEILATMRRLDPDRVVFATSPSAAYLVGDVTPVRRWPTEESDVRGTPDTDDRAGFLARLRCLPGGEAYLLRIDHSAHERRFLPRSALSADVGFEQVVTTPDGTLWLAHARGTRKSDSCSE